MDNQQITIVPTYLFTYNRFAVMSQMKEKIREKTIADTLIILYVHYFKIVLFIFDKL